MATKPPLYGYDSRRDLPSVLRPADEPESRVGVPASKEGSGLKTLGADVEAAASDAAAASADAAASLGEAQSAASNLLGQDAVTEKTAGYYAVTLADGALEVGDVVSAALDGFCLDSGDVYEAAIAFHGASDALISTVTGQQFAGTTVQRKVVEGVTIPASTLSIRVRAVAVGTPADDLTTTRAMLNRGPKARLFELPALRPARESAADLARTPGGAPLGDVVQYLDDVGNLVAGGKVDGIDTEVLSRALQGVFLETFDVLPATWNSRGTGTGTTALATGGTVGGSVLRATGQVWLAFPANIPYDPSKLYRFRARVRQQADPTTGGAECYLGVEGVAADGTTLVNNTGVASSSSQHYMAASASTLTVADGWQTFTGWFSGSGTPIRPAPDPLTPSPLHANVKYFRPLFLLSFSAGDGAAEIDYISIDIVDEEQARRAYTMLDGGADLGKLRPGAQASTGTAVNRLLAKTLPADPNTIDSVADGLVFGKPTYTQLYGADNAVVGLDNTGQVQSGVLSSATIAGILASIVGAGGQRGYNALDSLNRLIGNIAGNTDLVGGSLYIEDTASCKVGSEGSPYYLRKTYRKTHSSFRAGEVNSSDRIETTGSYTTTIAGAFSGANLWTDLLLPPGVTITKFTAMLSREGSATARVQLLRASGTLIADCEHTGSGWASVAVTLSELVTGSSGYTIYGSIQRDGSGNAGALSWIEVEYTRPAYDLTL